MNENENDKKLDWMYKSANSMVNRDEYLLGKPVDKALEQLNQEEHDKKLGLLPPKNHVEHECIPPSIRDFNKILQVDQVDLSAKLQEDPLVAIRKREEEARRQFLQNPIQLKKLQEALKQQEVNKQSKKKKNSKKSDSDSDLDQQIANKLKALKQNPLAIGITKKEKKKKQKDDSLDIILMHKYNELKSKLSQKDMDDILEGRTSSSSSDEDIERNKRRRDSSSSDNDKLKRIKNVKEDLRPRNSRVDKQFIERKNRKQQNSDSSEDRNNDRRKHREKEYRREKTYKKYTRRESSSEDEGKDRKYLAKKLQNKIENNSERSKRKTKNVRSKREESTESESSDEDKHVSRSRKQKKYEESSVRDEKNKRKERKQYKSDSSKEDEYKSRRDNKSSIRRDEKEEYRKQKWKGNKTVSTDEDNRKKRKSKVENKSKKKYSDSSSEDDKRKLKRQSKEESSSSSSETDDTRNMKRKENIRDKIESKKHNEVVRSENSSNKITTETELDQVILQKLRMLRNEIDSKEKESKETVEEPVYSHYDSDDDEHVYKKKSFGLVRADGTKIALKQNPQVIKAVETKKVEPPKELERKKPKKLSEKEKEELRRQMMKDAEHREKERSENLRKYREEDEIEEKERKSKDFDKSFVHKELLKSTKEASVESRIKSKLNNIQRSSRDMSSNFSKRH